MNEAELREPLQVTVVADAPRTELERSAAFRAYQRRLQDGMAHLEQLGAPAFDVEGKEVPPRAA
jgi:hypothetical protein